MFYILTKLCRKLSELHNQKFLQERKKNRKSEIVKVWNSEKTKNINYKIFQNITNFINRASNQSITKK